MWFRYLIKTLDIWAFALIFVFSRAFNWENNKTAIIILYIMMLLYLINVFLI